MSKNHAGEAARSTLIRYEWSISGMDCAACAAKARGAVERVHGATDVQVSLMKEQLRVSLDESRGGPQDVERAVRTLGYSAHGRRRMGGASGEEGEEPTTHPPASVRVMPAHHGEDAEARAQRLPAAHGHARSERTRTFVVAQEQGAAGAADWRASRRCMGK